MPRSVITSGPRTAVLTILAGLAGACREPAVVSRPPPDRTLGAELFGELCLGVARTADPSGASAEARSLCWEGASPTGRATPRLRALGAERARFVAAVDDAVPPGLGRELGEVLTDLAAVGGRQDVQAGGRAVASTLARLLASPEAMRSLARAGARRGYRPRELAIGLPRAAGYPALGDAARALVQLVRSGGPAVAPWRQLVESAGRDLPRAAAVLAGASRFLLVEDPALGDGVPRWVARRDRRGVVLPQTTPAGALVLPFVDFDRDGLADVDDSGRLVGSDGRPIALGAPFPLPGEPPRPSLDRWGRPRFFGQLVYQYRDASSTVLGALLHESGALVGSHPDALFDLWPPLVTLAGAPSYRRHTWADGATSAFDGFSPDDSPALDLAWAVGTVAGTPESYQALRLARSLVAGHEPALARVADALLGFADLLAAPPFRDLALEPRRTLADDLLDVLEEIAREPGLLEDVLRALRDPLTRDLWPILARHLRSSDRLVLDPADVDGPPLGDLVTPVDRARPDAGDNVSVFQRLAHLLHDANHARLCNRRGATLDLDGIRYPWAGTLAPCELFEIDDLAVFYLQAIIGRAELRLHDPLLGALPGLDSLLESSSGITGLTRTPTARALHRVVFAPRNQFLQDLLDPPLCADGVPFEARHQGTAFAAELPGFFEHARPLLTAFDDHHRLDLLADLVSVLHRHWATPRNDTTQGVSAALPAFSHQSGLVRFEEAVARALDDLDVPGAAGELSSALAESVVEGRTGDAVVADLARRLLLPEWSASLAVRAGAPELRAGDGVTPVGALSPARLLLAAFRHAGAALAVDPLRRDRAREAALLLLRRVLRTEEVAGTRRFAERRIRALAQVAVTFAGDRLLERIATGEGGAWARAAYDDLAGALDHPGVAALLLLADAVSRDPGARAAVAALLAYLTSPGSPDHTYDTVLTAGVDLAQAAVDREGLEPLLAALAPVLASDGVVRSPATLHDVLARDRRDVLSRVLAGLVAARDGRETPLETLVDIACKVDRVSPGDTGPYDLADWTRIVGTLAAFFEDRDHELGRLYDLLASRRSIPRP